jgi:hypothetical protein
VALVLEAEGAGKDPKPTLQQPPSDAAGPPAEDRPHFGEQGPRQQTTPKPARRGILPANKHAMLSYQWDDQEQVVAARKTLTRLGCPCWMDIDGGMQADLYESMAAGVENAACVVCFLSQKYQDSENCKLELKFAKQSGVPIIPVMLGGTKGWRPSGWLGIVVAGALWTPLREGSDFQSGVQSLVDQIKSAVPGPGAGAHSDDDDYEEEEEEQERGGADAASAELRAELDRLRKQIEAHDSKPTIKDASSAAYNADAPAELHVGVPELPDDFRVTAEIKQLQQVLLKQSKTQTKVVGDAASTVWEV